MKIAILTSRNQWFEKYTQVLANKLADANIYTSHKDIVNGYDILFILSYHQVVKKETLELNKHNIVIHASSLPKGKGWSPLFWQVIDGANEITFTMFEASEKVDNGGIYLQKNLSLTGYELNAELRQKQACLTMEMCLEFITGYARYKVSKSQKGIETFYRKRTSEDSKLDVNKSILDQFDLLRTVDNDSYPAFFEINGNRYRLKIERD